MKRRLLTPRQIWAWPIGLTLASLAALVLALFEDEGVLDLLCAAVLAVLVWLCGWHGWLKYRFGRRRAGSPK